MPLTLEAKKLLAETIRDLRVELVRGLRDEAERRYRLSTPLEKSGLDEARRAERARLTTLRGGELDEAAVKEAAATFLCRVILLRQLEALGLSRPALVTGAFQSRAYREFREFAPGLTGDESEGYATLLRLTFDELAEDLPLLFADEALTALLPVPPAALRAVLERLDDPRLGSAWSDDTTLGWVYQFWNEPERRAIDARLDAQNKLEPGEIAVKTQIFTERYMVEWLLEQSLSGIRPEAAQALKLLDPACGSGHFLVIAFDRLAALHRRAAEDRGESPNNRKIAESILEDNLFGIDLDASAVRIAAAALLLKAKAFARDARPKRLNLATAPPPFGSLLRLEAPGEGPESARLFELTRPRSYDVVLGNPPYFGTQSLADTAYLDRAYPESKENLCTAFFERATELARPGGAVALVTVRNWLYVSQLAEFRARIFRTFPPTAVADLGLAGFESLPGVESVLIVAREGASGPCRVIDARDGGASEKATTLARQERVFRCEPALLAKLPGSPFVYRWDGALLRDFLSGPLLGEVAPVRVGMKTTDNLRFLRAPWELDVDAVKRAVKEPKSARFVPYIKGAAGKAWIEPLSTLVDWKDQGLAVRIALEAAYKHTPQGEKYFFQRGVAFSTIGRSFVARAHRYASLFDVAGSSVFPPDLPAAVCLLNSRRARRVVEDLNPTINFQVGDVARVPYRPDARAARVFQVLERAFDAHERADERSPKFERPEPSPWRGAQAWAQAIVDSEEEHGLPPYTPELEPVTAFCWLSFALGIALGRFGANGEGWRSAPPTDALPSGLLYVSSGTLEDSLAHAATLPLRRAWEEHHAALGGGELRKFLREAFFDLHRKHYEGRPIYLPLSSAKKSFVALVSVHRLSEHGLRFLLADHLHPERRRFEGELDDLRVARAHGAPSENIEKRFAELTKLHEELSEFIAQITHIADRGPPPSEPGAPEREVDAPFRVELEDGVMLNAAALWPLLAPHWKEPKKWWARLSRREGPKGAHFDWSKTAARYFPTRVREACERDPVLASAHGCLWQHHPSVAYAWELRLQHQLSSDYTITESDAAHRKRAFLERRPEEAARIASAEAKRRARQRRQGSG